MRNCLLLLSVFSAGISMPAQQISSNNASRTEGCPIGFGAQVNARAVEHRAEDTGKNSNRPLLELTFERHGTAKVMGAVIKAHGSVFSSRLLPVTERTGENRTQTFDLGGAIGLRDTSVWVTELSYVSWAEVTELKYADGSSWHASSAGQCRAVPSKLRLVDAVAQ